MLKRIKIQGYKSLVDLEVNFGHLAVLVGPNASGKSNFLDALHLLSRVATSRTLKEAFDPPYRGHALESFTFGEEGIKSLLEQETVSFSIEVDVQLSPKIVENVNQQIQISADITNKQEESQSFVYFVQIKEKSGVVVSLGWISGPLAPFQKLSPSLSWTPEKEGEYTAEIFVWEDFKNYNALAENTQVQINVS